MIYGLNNVIVLFYFLFISQFLLIKIGQALQKSSKQLYQNIK